MKRHLVALFALAAVASLAIIGAGTSLAAPGGCATIKGGTITDALGNAISVGYDEFGYNYQAHSFNGTYDSSDRVLDGAYWGDTGDYVDDKLAMKWSNDWLSNTDCDLNGKLDRGAEAPYGISQGWLTNHVVGDYDSDANGSQDAKYTDFVKIVWVGPGGSLWDQYEIIQEIYNDTVAGNYRFKAGAPGLGLNDHWTP